MKISVIGTGAYGLAIALSLAKNGNEIMMWTENVNKELEFRETGKLASILPNDVPYNIKISSSFEEVLKNTKLIYIVTTSKYVASVCDGILPFYKTSIPVCIAAKGLEESSLDLLSNIVEKKLKTKNIAVISGPTFAIDMANNEPVALALAANNARTKNLVLQTLPGDTLKLRPTDDLIGIQLCGSVKNIIAIASGILEGLGYSDSSRSFLINESLHDIKHIIKYLGGNPKTILSFAGIGDLMLTCSSKKSRNFSFGYVIGNTKNKEKIEEYLTNNTVEGYYTLEIVYNLLKRKKINIELINVIYDIVYKFDNPEILAKFLITKE